MRVSGAAIALLLGAPALAAVAHPARAEPPAGVGAGAAAAAHEALAALPEGVRAGVQIAWQRPGCNGADPHVAVAVDTAAGRLSVCAGAGGASVRRQVTFGAYLVADARHGWSAAGSWRRLNGWSRTLAPPWGWRAHNQAAGAHADPAGQRSPAWDLASFAAAWTEERSLAPAQADAPLQCRLLPQAVFLHARLRALSALPEPLRAPPSCRAFERWADRGRLARVEIALAAPSTVTMASMFGHVFLRLVTRSGDGEPALLEDRTLAFLVETAAPITEERFYALKGIGGAFEANLVERSFLETYRTYVVMEGRDLRRYHLRLTPAETEALLQRLWSLRQASRYRYFFFGTNCATLMVDLVNSVLPDDRQIRFPQAIATTPGGTLEGYARTAAASGGPLLSFIPETILSFEHEARRAAAKRDQAVLRLRSAAGIGARARHDALWEAVLASGPAARAQAYAAFYQHHRDTADPGALAAVLRQSALVETHLCALANLAAEQERFRERRERLFATLADLRRRLQRPAGDAGPCGASLPALLDETGSPELAARLRGYRRARDLLAGACAGDAGRADDLRRLVLLQSEARHDDPAIDPPLRDAILFPEREKTLGEQRFAAGLSDLVDYPFVTEVSPAVSALAAARADLTRRHGTVPGAWRLQREEAAARRHEEAAAHASAVPRTGIDELEAGGGLGRSAAGVRGLLVLAGAMHDERLGDQRRFGFAAHTALTVARTRTALALDGLTRWPAVPAWQTRLLGYRSLRPSHPRPADRPGGPGFHPRPADRPGGPGFHPRPADRPGGPGFHPRPADRPGGPGSVAGGLQAGGEVHADVGGRAWLGRPLEARLGAGYLLPVLRSADLSDHLILGAGLVGSFDRIGSAHSGHAVWGAGASFAVEGRLALDRRNHARWLAARAQIRPFFTSQGPAAELTAGGELRLPLREGVRLPLAGAGAIGLRLSAEVVAFTRPAALDPQMFLTIAWE